MGSPPWACSPMNATVRLSGVLSAVGLNQEDVTQENLPRAPGGLGWRAQSTEQRAAAVEGPAVLEEQRAGGRRDSGPWLRPGSLPPPLPALFGLLPELFPRVVSSLACRQVWMFCQHSREFMIACRCASKNTLYPEQKLMQA